MQFLILTLSIRVEGNGIQAIYPDYIKDSSILPTLDTDPGRYTLTPILVKLDVHPTRYHLFGPNRSDTPSTVRQAGNDTRRLISIDTMCAIGAIGSQGNRNMLGDMGGAGGYSSGNGVPLD